MKRFWDHVTVAARDGGHAVLLDGRPLHLPGGAALSVRAPPLAEAIAGEWETAGGRRGGTFGLDDTPLTRLAGTATERIAPDPAPTATALAAYGESDLLCYRAERPAELARRQAGAWDPWLDWAAERLDARLRVGAGVMHVPQDPAARAALGRAVDALAPEALAGLGVIVPALGSLVLGLALAQGALDAAAAVDTALLDELFQAESWGEDAEAAARRATLRRDVANAARFMALAAT